MNATLPKYISLYHSGELKRRAEGLYERLASCDICPRQCRINRLEGELGFCHSGHRPIVSSFCAHHGEEPALSGSRGSGTIFFGNCNMRCLYCQNYQISQDWQGQKANEIDGRNLAKYLLYLQDELGCHNINFVSPSHFVPQLVQAVCEAVPLGLNIPLVYNTNSYDSLKTLKELDGIISIYLPDLKYASDTPAEKLSQVADYVTTARHAIKEMWRQVGELVLDEWGVAEQGVIVRHLILPNGLAGSEESLTWLAGEVSPDVTVSLMSQYFPQHQARQVTPLARTISAAEYAAVLRVADRLGVASGWRQGMEAQRYYRPDFERKGRPFALKAGPG